MKIVPWESQVELSDIGFEVLKKHGLVYLNMEERTGKTVTAILIAEASPAVVSVLVVTVKSAMEDWVNTIDNIQHLCAYTVINYHSVQKVKGEFDLVILDEAHNYISGFPKRKSIWCNVRKYTSNKPLIFMSATSSAQGRHLLFNQLALSDWSPWVKYKDYYRWHSKYGIPNQLYLHGRFIEKWDKVDTDKVWSDCSHLFIAKTRKELGFEQEPEDKLHYIELDKITKEVYNELQTRKMITLSCGEIIADSSMRLRSSLHMLEGGVAIIKDDMTEKSTYHVLANREKVDYILAKWGDIKDLVIMYNYKAEKIKLEREFKNVRLLQATSFAEGIDLYEYKDLVIYSQDFRTAKHTQRRARQANKNRKEPIKVHFLLVKKAISDQVYTTVSVNKTNFVDSTYAEERI